MQNTFLQQKKKKTGTELPHRRLKCNNVKTNLNFSIIMSNYDFTGQFLRTLP